MRFRFALLGAKSGRPFARLMPDRPPSRDAGDGPQTHPPVSRNDDPQTFAPQAPRKKRVALMTGCAQKALNTDINDATIRLLTRLGCEVVVAEGAGCCGALDPSHGQSPRKPRHGGQEHHSLGAEMDGTGWTPSSSTPPAAAPPSRITATCSAMTPWPPMRARVAALPWTSAKC